MRRWLTPRQAIEFRKRLWPMLDYLRRCRDRLDAIEYEHGGQLYRTMDGAAKALEELYRLLYHEALGLDVTQAKDRAQDRPNHPGA
jgi:hypothetical protein